MRLLEAISMSILWKEEGIGHTFTDKPGYRKDNIVNDYRWNQYLLRNIKAEHRSKFEALHRKWWCLHMNETFWSVTKKSQANKSNIWFDSMLFYLKLYNIQCFFDFQNDMNIWQHMKMHSISSKTTSRINRIVSTHGQQ